MHSYTYEDRELLTKLQSAQGESVLESAQRALAEPPPPPPGPTGRFPGGQLTPLDEGELAFQLGVVDGKVVINFGHPVQAVGFSPKQALDLADLLRKQAKSIKPDRPRHGRKTRG